LEDCRVLWNCGSRHGRLTGVLPAATAATSATHVPRGTAMARIISTNAPPAVSATLPGGRGGLPLRGAVPTRDDLLSSAANDAAHPGPDPSSAAASSPTPSAPSSSPAPAPPTPQPQPPKRRGALAHKPARFAVILVLFRLKSILFVLVSPPFFSLLLLFLRVHRPADPDVLPTVCFNHIKVPFCPCIFHVPPLFPRAHAQGGLWTHANRHTQGVPAAGIKGLC